MDELLRARLRIPEVKTLPLLALRGFMRAVDAITRLTTGQAFFAIREAEALLIELDGRTGQDLVGLILSKKGGTTIKTIGLENVPAKGPVVIASTHPIGTFDFISHAGALLPHRPDLKVVANREAERFLGKDRIIAVDLNGADKVLTPRQTVSEMVSHLNVGGALLVFGSGRVPGMTDGVLTEQPWRTGITRTSATANAPILPASANMRNSRHYYRTRRLAKWLSRGNDDFARAVAPLRYVSEFLAKLGGTYTVHYGPIQNPGTSPEELQKCAERLVPGLYRVDD